MLLTPYSTFFISAIDGDWSNKVVCIQRIVKAKRIRESQKMKQYQNQNHKTIQAILFDADGVVIFPNRFARYLERELHLTQDVTSQFFDGVFLECLVGQADLKEALAPFLPHWGWRSSIDEFLKRWFDEENAVDHRMIKVVAQLRWQGFFCGLATNQERYRLEYMRTQMGLTILFNKIFGSAAIGAMKNDPRYFERVTELLDLPIEKILLWDDSQRNVEVARAFGWKAERFTTFESFLETLQQYVLWNDAKSDRHRAISDFSSQISCPRS